MDFLTLYAIAATPRTLPLTLVFTTTGPSQEVRVPLRGNHNVTVFWGDGTSDSYSYTGPDVIARVHTFSAAGTYTVRVFGAAAGFGVNEGFFSGRGNLVRCLSFGDLGLTDLVGAFAGATNLIQVPARLPAGVTTAENMFRLASSFNQDISGWDVSSVTTMDNMFLDASAFNQTLNAWNTSSVTTMSGMFFRATAFNGEIGSWNVSNVTSMLGMFSSAPAFNRNIGSWNTSSVTSMSSMFSFATSFNQNIGGWDTSSATAMFSMFDNATSFNQDLSGWCVSLIATQPFGFDSGATAWTLPNSRPVWGTCP